MSEVTTNQGQLIFDATVQRAYRPTRERFLTWASNDAYRHYTVPPSTSPEIGFAIFYKVARLQPRLLIVVGQNPSNFAGPNRSLSAEPNAQMLAGRPPAASSYDVHEHLFGIALRAAFEDDPELYAGCVGMNVWHFQCVAQAASAPEALRSFCEETTAELVAAMQPKNILRVGRQSFDALAREGRRVPGTRVLIGYFAKADIDPANALYTNALMGMKPGSAVGDVPTVPGYQDQCLMFLQRQIEIVQPRLVVALGKKARLCLTRIGVDAVYPLRPSARELKPKATRETIVSTQAKRFNTP